MNTVQFLAAFAIATVFLLMVIRFANRAHEDDGVKVPKHVPVNEADFYSAQEVYNWVVYVTRLTGFGYLEQVNWDHTQKHNDLMQDLCKVLYLRGEAEIEDWFTRVGDTYDLDTSIVSMPI